METISIAIWSIVLGIASYSFWSRDWLSSLNTQVSHKIYVLICICIVVIEAFVFALIVVQLESVNTTAGFLFLIGIPATVAITAILESTVWTRNQKGFSIEFVWAGRQKEYQQRKQEYATLREKLEQIAGTKFDCVPVYEDPAKKKGFQGIGLRTYTVGDVRDPEFRTLQRPELQQEQVKILTYDNAESFTFAQLKALKDQLEALSNERTIDEQRILRKVKKLVEDPDQYLQDEENYQDKARRVEADITLSTRDNAPLKIAVETKSSSKDNRWRGSFGIFVFTFLVTLFGCGIASTATRGVFGQEISFGIALFFWIFLQVYFLPSHIAYRKGHSSGDIIFVLNLFLGWSGIVWIVVLIWAFIDKD